MLFVIYVTSCLMVIKSIDANTNRSSDNVVEETQHAICKIATEDIEATANASITRQLKGVCHTDDMHEQLQELEDRLMKKIVNLLQEMFEPHKSQNSYNIKLNGNENGVTTKNVYDAKFYYKNLIDASKKRDVGVGATLAPPMRKNLTKNITEKSRSFEEEFKHNNSIISDDEHGKMFVYYWKIEDITKTLQEKDVFITSPHFLVKGTINYMKFSPHHLDTKYTCLELDNLIPNYYKYRFMILNQYNAKNDLSSQLLCKLESFAKMFRISYEKLNKFIANDEVVVKLLIYLDM